MKKRTRNSLAVLLTTALILTMNTGVFAEEIFEEYDGVEYGITNEGYELTSEECEIDGYELTSETNASDNGITSSTNAVSVSADKLLSENAVEISANLASKSFASISGDSATYVLIYPTAIPYTGQKPGSKKYKIEVKAYSHTGTVSPDSYNALSSNETAKAAGWEELDIKKVGIKASKGATLGIDSKGTVEAKKGTYIKSIKLSNKEANKAFNKAFKDVFKATKKNTEIVSGNGMNNGKYVPLVIPVYPSYAGNDKEAIKIAKSLGMTVTTLDFSKTKYKDGLPKSIKGTVEGKKVTLKPTKKPGKYKGFGSENKTTPDTNSLKAESYVQADGNFCGNIYYTAK